MILGSGSGGRGIPGSKPFDGGVQLFDMAKDPAETTDLADKNEAVVAELTELLQEFRDSGRSRPASE